MQSLEFHLKKTQFAETSLLIGLWLSAGQKCSENDLVIHGYDTQIVIERPIWIGLEVKY